MKKKTNIVIIALIFISLLFSLFYLYSYNQPKQNSRLPSFTFQKVEVKLRQHGLFYAEICPIDLKNDGFLDFVILTQNIQNLELPSPLVVYQRGPDNTFEIKTLNDIKFVHPRNCQVGDFNGDGLPDLIVADHGYDHPPYSGGYPKLIFSDQFGNLKQAPKSFFDTKSIFNFNIAVADFNSDKKDDIFLVNIASDAPQLLLNSSYQKMQDHPDSLPVFLKNIEKKFLGAATLDIDQDGFIDLVLGGHGGQMPNENFERDVVLFGSKDGALNERHPNFFPVRPRGGDLSSVEIITAEFNDDKYPDIAVLYHTVGLMTDGYVDFYKNNKGENFSRMKISSEFKKPEGVNIWFPRAVTFRPNWKNRDDLIVITRPSTDNPNISIPKVIYYSNEPNGFAAHTDLFAEISNYPVGLFTDDWNSDGLEDIIFLLHDGSLVIALSEP